jgi:hypothetical protein
VGGVSGGGLVRLGGLVSASGSLYASNQYSPMRTQASVAKRLFG